jgi:hypothetical protein
MNAVQEYVQQLPDSERVLIVQGYEELQKKGVIGDEPIRLHAQALITSLGMDKDSHIAIWMCQLASEVFRYYAHRYIHLRTCAKCDHPDRDQCKGHTTWVMCQCDKCHADF